MKYATYVGAFGLFAYAGYEFFAGDQSGATKTVFQALALLGIGSGAHAAADQTK